MYSELQCMEKQTVLTYFKYCSGIFMDGLKSHEKYIEIVGTSECVCFELLLYQPL
jgi:hypothetical protein